MHIGKCTMSSKKSNKLAYCLKNCGFNWNLFQANSHNLKEYTRIHTYIHKHIYIYKHIHTIMNCCTFLIPVTWWWTESLGSQQRNGQNTPATLNYVRGKSVDQK